MVRILAFWWMGLAVALGQVYNGKTLVEASLVADTTAIVPGEPFTVGLRLRQAPGWHTYWQFPGDAGLPTSIRWELPEGFHAGAIDWPLPTKIVEPGDIYVYAYKDDVVLLSTIVPPKDLALDSVTLRAKASWLVCEEICIPGGAELELTLPVGASASPANEALIGRFRSLIPLASAPPFGLAWSQADGATRLTVTRLPPGGKVEFFPLPEPDQSVGHPTVSEANDGAVEVTIPASGVVRGVLAVASDDTRAGWMVESGAGNVATAPAPMLPGNLFLALASGFLGGLILNLMPCVLPVISLKIFGFVRQAGDDPRRILLHGLAFAGGIFAWFFGLAAVVIALKTAGSEVTWAFQFQNPWFNVFIGTVVFVFALNLFGVFEVVLPGQATTALTAASDGGGVGGAFWQGVLATLLATPCTAPFLGSALGFAFSQSGVVILAMFGAVALGMASPYVLLSARPGWMVVLPRPGAWMERLKQFMGFPLIATLVWIFSILGGQKGVGGMVWFAAFLTCLAVACWIYGAFCGPLSKSRTRAIALAVIAFFVLGGGAYFLGVQFPNAAAGPAVPSKDGIAWVPFSAAELARLRAEGKPVFVDFTADWCLSCKFNERTAIDTPKVREIFESQAIVPMKADWTNANPEITAALKEFGRVGVPFYVLYPADNAPPITLPELLTEAIVVDALAKAR